MKRMFLSLLLLGSHFFVLPPGVSSELEVTPKTGVSTNTTPPSSVLGPWYMGGDPKKHCAIVTRMGFLFAENEYGHRSRLVLEPENKVTATDWDDGITGRVEADMILWRNGTWWARTPER